MAPFEIQDCVYCGKNAIPLTRTKYQDCVLCSKCSRKLSPYWRSTSLRTAAEVTAQLRYRDENKQLLAGFRPNIRVGTGETCLFIDEAAGTFVVATELELQRRLPDLFQLVQVTDVSCQQADDNYCVNYLVVVLSGHPFIRNLVRMTSFNVPSNPLSLQRDAELTEMVETLKAAVERAKQRQTALASGQAAPVSEPAQNPAPAPAAVPAQAPTAATGCYRVGDSVAHVNFGHGRILTVTPAQGDVLLEIAFDNAGVMRFYARAAAPYLRKL